MNSQVRSTTDTHENRLHSPSADSSVTFHENTKQWFIAVLVSLSLATNIVLGALILHGYRAKEQAEDLKRYDLDFFKQNDWATLKAQVEINEKLIQAYGLQKAVRDAAKEK